MKIVIETIPYDQMRYPTLGDYWTDDQGVWHIKVVETENIDWALIAVHELVEMILCYDDNVPENVIDGFDFGWLPHDGIAEPGDDPAAPYYRQHQRAMIVERLLASFLYIDWHLYEKRCDSYQIPRTEGL